MESNKLQRGSVWWINLDPTQGSEIKKIRLVF
jgi:mRNA-degrading endonuclease toxin of MazEF toxin-antitoxin module